MIYPFRLGATSYIIPADIITNLNYIGNRLDDVELILFETPGESNLPSPIDIEVMLQIASNADLTFTVHLPTDKKIEIGNHDSIDEFVKSVCKTVVLSKPLNPYAYILHLEGINSGSSGSELTAWQNAHSELLYSILNQTNIPAQLLCIENLAYPWQWFKELADEFRTSYCLDIGHLWATNASDWESEAAAMIIKARVIHLHGLCSRGDHCSLADSDSKRTEQFLRLVKCEQYNHVITLEVFNKKDLDESIECVKDIWEKLSS